MGVCVCVFGKLLAQNPKKDFQVEKSTHAFMCVRHFVSTALKGTQIKDEGWQLGRRGENEKGDEHLLTCICF